MRQVLVRTRLGMLGVVIALAAAAVIEYQWGRIYGVYGWREVAAGLMIAGGLLFAGAGGRAAAQPVQAHLPPL